MTLPKSLTTVTVFSKTVAIFLYLVVFIIGFYLGVFYKQTSSVAPSKVPSIPPKPSPTDETANWKTYANKGVYFKYPSDWNISPYTDDSVITSSSPKIKLAMVPKTGTLMNECMREISEQIIRDGLAIKKFTSVTSGAMCSVTDPTLREIWVVPGKSSYSPGISYQYSATESAQAEEIFNQILSTFKFTDNETGDSSFTVCVQVITPARDSATGICKKFPTPCDVPQGWIKVESC